MSAGKNTGRARTEKRYSVGHVLESCGIPIFLVLLIFYFGFISSIGSDFRSSANIQDILANQSVTGLIAIGTVLPLVAGYFDLSVSASAGLASVTFAAVSGNHHQALILGIVLGLVAALIVGVVNAVLVAVIRLNAFIITFGMYTLIGGLLQFYTGGSPIGQGLPQSLGNFGNSSIIGIPVVFWLLMIVAIVAWYVLTQTPFGRGLSAIGSSENAARLAGLRVNRGLVIAFLTSAFFGGLAGILLTTQTMQADSTTAESYLFPALAAVFLGQTAIRPGFSNVWGAMFGVFVVAVAVSGLQLLGAATWVTPVFDGGALMASVAASTLLGRLRTYRAASVLASEMRASSLENVSTEEGAT
jgi:ribose transport system permease protein